jgi:hypothetical protein
MNSITEMNICHMWLRPLAYAHLGSPFSSWDRNFSLTQVQKISSVALAALPATAFFCMTTLSPISIGIIGGGLGLSFFFIATAAFKGANLLHFHSPMVCLLKDNHLLTQANLTAVVNCDDRKLRDRVLFVFDRLERTELIAGVNCDDCNFLRPILYRLKKANILTQANFTAIVNCKNRIFLNLILLNLKEANILDQANFTAVVNCKNLEAFLEILFCLKEANILDQANFTAVEDCDDLGSLNLTLCHLRKAVILTQANFTAVVNDTTLWTFSKLLYCLREANILTQANFIASRDYENPEIFRQTLSFLSQNNELTQSSFNYYVRAPYGGLMRYVASHLPPPSPCDLYDPGIVDF